MIPAKLLPLIFAHVEWKELLLVIPSVCSEWRQISGRNFVWREQLRRNRKLFTIDCLLEFEKLFLIKQQEELQNLRLRKDINQVFCKIGLLVRHTQCRHSYTSIPSHQLFFGRARSEGCVSNNSYNGFRHDIKEHIAIFQTIIYLIDKIHYNEIESIQNNKGLFRWSYSTLKLHPNIVLNSNKTMEFLRHCKQNGMFVRSIFINMMKTMYSYKEKNSQFEREAADLAASALDLNIQLDGYKRFMQGILFRYSFISRNKEAKFSMKKLEKKGVIISSVLTQEQKRNISFRLTYATLGAFHLHVYMSGKQIDAILLEVSDILSKVYENIMAAWFDNFLLNTGNTLRLIERYMLQ